jgi:hypothetical protein
MKKNLSPKIEDKLLATHVTNNKDFEAACLTGNGSLIKTIVETEMQKNKLFTKGSEKLKADILKLLQGKEKVSVSVGQNILMFVWNSRMSGIGFAAN